MRCALLLVACLPVLLLGPSGWAEDTPKLPRDHAAAAGLVQKAFAAADEDLLKAFAVQPPPPDAWVIVDHLCGQGALEAAAAYAALVPAPYGTRLPTLVALEKQTPTPNAARKAYVAALVHARAGRLDEVLTTIAGAGTVGGVTGSRLLFLRGDALRALRRPVPAAAAFGESAALAETIGWLARGAAAYKTQARTLVSAGLREDALAARAKVVAVERQRNVPLHLAMALIDQGTTAASAGRLEVAERALAEGEPLADRLGARSPQAIALRAMAMVAMKRGQFQAARDRLERALVMIKKSGRASVQAGIHNDLGITIQRLNDPPLALDHYRRARMLYRKVGNARGEAGILVNVGLLHLTLGRYAMALASLEEGLEAATRARHRLFAAKALLNLATVYITLHDAPKARAHATQAQAAYKALNVRSGAARVLKVLADIHMMEGHPKLAVEQLREAAAYHRQVGDDASLSACLGDLCRCLLKAHRPDDALEAANEAIAIHERNKTEGGLARALVNRGPVQRTLGDLDGAVASYDRAFEIGQRADLLVPMTQALQNRAALELGRKNWQATLKYVERAAELFPRATRGLAEGQGAQANEAFLKMFRMGAFAAHKIQDAPTGFALAERARGITLREALGGGELLESIVLPPALREAERRARIVLANARDAFQRGRRRRRTRRELRVLRAAVEVAEGEVEAVARRTQRAARLASGLVHPEPVELVDFFDTLEGDQAYLSFEVHPSFVQVFRVVGTSVRSYQLQNMEAFRAAVDALQAADAAVDPAPAVRRLREALQVPDLKLDPAIRRLLIAPAGKLAFVPWSLIFPDYEVCLLPSATVYAHLRCRPPLAGTKILGFGGPLYRRGRGLAALPAAAEEARAVSDVTFTGADAAEAAVRKALSGDAAWRAIHFACHGVIDFEHPLHSRLAVSAGGDDDGNLTATEILTLRTRTKLVTLSACETGLGRTYGAEGVIGLTRAFFIAGAPRVLCSLWKVDDEATKALMLKFYELWNPKTGRGLGAAAALKRAQAFVRGDPRWEHPYYWAAWVLWGLPD